ncbi:MAG: electron transport complex subunit E [Kiritimatiellia bacterium]
MKLFKEFIKGLWEENPIFRLVLGMCPTLAVTTSLENGIGMGIAATFVLVCSNLVVSSIRRLIPPRVRIPCFIVVIATFVTVVDLVMKAFRPELHDNLGIFIPLIVVNCIILARAEAFASKNTFLYSFADGLGMGIGFTLGLAVLGACREILGDGSLTLWGDISWRIPGTEPLVLFILAPGGFITLGCLLGLMNQVQSMINRRRGKTFVPPAHLDCRHCVLRKWSGSPQDSPSCSTR